jgi:G3E family GTPase
MMSLVQLHTCRSGEMRLSPEAPKLARVSTQQPVPILLVGGFLGSGKTTLMRRLIMDAHARGLKIAVIVNEFGATDIDSNILRELEREAANEILTGIAGGCACCTGQDELHWTLLEIGQRTDESRPDIILMEASGVADPILLLDVTTATQLLPLVRPALLIGVVDAERYANLQPDVAPLLRRQVQMADVIVLNKIDLASSVQIEQTRHELAQLNSHARIEIAVQCEVDCGLLWHRALHATQGNDAPRVLDSAASSEPAPHTHFQTVLCPLPHPIERGGFEAALQNLPPNVWRAKGFVRLRGEGLYLLQYTGGGAQARYQLAPYHLPVSTQEPETSLVFIGAALDRNAILHSFRSSLLTMLY